LIRLPHGGLFGLFTIVGRLCEKSDNLHFRSAKKDLLCKKSKCGKGDNLMKLDQELVITCFSSAHAEAVSGLIQGSMSEALAEASPEQLESCKEQYTKERILRQMNDRMTYVAVFRNRIVGVIVLAASGTDRLVEAICVLPEHRDEGIGAMLVETAEKRVGELGGKLIRVSPLLKDNGFFRKLGYCACQEDAELAKMLA
jgi:predicted N-acetyltransferase YhbS